MLSWLRRPLLGKTNPRPLIRFARSEDSAALAKLHAQGFDKAWGVTDFEALIADRSVIGHVAVLDGRVCGFVLSRQAADEAEILSIVTEKKQRGNGHGRQLLQWHMDALLPLRIKMLFLEVETENELALRLYKKLGFLEIGRRKSYYRKVDGTSADALTMKKRFE
jgi:[ribosomal protein S18]-alanine N-acetyltransferase